MVIMLKYDNRTVNYYFNIIREVNIFVLVRIKCCFIFRKQINTNGIVNSTQNICSQLLLTSLTSAPVLRHQTLRAEGHGSAPIC